MGRPASAWTAAGLLLAGLAGVAWQLRQAEVTTGAMHASAAAVALGVGVLAMAWRRRLAGRSGASIGRRVAEPIAWLLLAGSIAALAWSATDWRTARRLADALPTALEGRDLVVEGIVASLPQATDASVRFRFELDGRSRDHPDGRLPGTVSLGWYAAFHDDAALTAPQRTLQAGQRWRFTVRLRRPHGNANPHGFDLELWLFEQGIRRRALCARRRCSRRTPAASPSTGGGSACAMPSSSACRMRGLRACSLLSPWATKGRSTARIGRSSATPASPI
jgi:competence protein ComEC